MKNSGSLFIVIVCLFSMVRLRVEAAAPAQAQGTFSCSSNVNSPNYDLFQLQPATLTGCQIMCQGTPLCVGLVLDTSSICYLKTAITSFVAGPGITTCTINNQVSPSTSVFCPISLPVSGLCSSEAGYTLSSYSNYSPSQCASTCSTTSLCAAYSYSPSTALNTCQLFEFCESVTPEPTNLWMSYYVAINQNACPSADVLSQFSCSSNTDRPYNDIAQYHPVLDLGTCASLCLSSSSSSSPVQSPTLCTTFVLSASTQICYLKSAVGTPNTNSQDTACVYTPYSSSVTPSSSQTPFSSSVQFSSSVIPSSSQTLYSSSGPSPSTYVCLGNFSLSLSFQLGSSSLSASSVDSCHSQCASLAAAGCRGFMFNSKTTGTECTLVTQILYTGWQQNVWACVAGATVFSTSTMVEQTTGRFDLIW